MKTKSLSIILLFLSIQSIYAQDKVQRSTTFSVKCPTELFIGQVLKASSLNKDTYEFPTVQYNPITVSFSGLYHSVEIAPSYISMMSTLKESVVNNIVQNNAFSFKLRELKSYGELNLFFGQEINRLKLFGISPTKKINKTTVIIDISKTALNIGMDLPSSPHSNVVVSGSLSDLVYVTSIQFGRKCTILVESTCNYQDVKEAVQEILKYTGTDESKISEKSKSIIANSTVRTMCLNSDVIEDSNPDNPFANILSYLNKPFTPDDFGSPILFDASYLEDNSPFENQFTF